LQEFRFGRIGDAIASAGQASPAAQGSVPA
jgi:hypothetical protein